MRVEEKNILLLGLVLVSILSLVQMGGASYSFDGVPYSDKLDLVSHGSFKGSVYVGETRGLDFPPYEQSFELPENIKVKWARLYVGVWGGTERYEGWVHTMFNGHDLGNTVLRGINDDNPHVYSSSHGSYWVYYNVSDKVVPGLNTGIADTSRGEKGNKLDGRVYGIILVAIYEAGNAPETSYWVCEGNPSLHGKGWAGAVPSINDFASVQFSGKLRPENAKAADITVVYLAGNLGEPDYLEFNGYEIGGNDVANNEDSKTYGIDLKIFEVTPHVQAENNLLFLRGKDVNADGMIETDDEGNLEGEYYIHPVLAVLTVEHKTPEKTAPDFSIDLDLKDAIEGENTLTAIVHNYGRSYEGEVTLTVLVDNANIYWSTVHMDASGMAKAAIPWVATRGAHTITVEVDAENAVSESNENNNVNRLEVFVGQNPDLSVKILTPIRQEIGIPTATGITIAGSCLVALLLALVVLSLNGGSKRSHAALLLSAVLCVAVMASGCLNEQSGGDQTLSKNLLKYSVPVEITNEGEMPAMTFELSLYVDGEKSVTKTIDGLEGRASITEDLPIVVTKGAHSIRAVVDEKNKIEDSRRDNNVDEITFEF
jgi:subtilase family serine protease